jgi:hypothetical protein
MNWPIWPPANLKVYDGLDQLWRMVERYKVTAPITITVVDKTALTVGEVVHADNSRCSGRAAVFRDQKSDCRYQCMSRPEPDPVFSVGGNIY